MQECEMLLLIAMWQYRLNNGDTCIHGGSHLEAGVDNLESQEWGNVGTLLPAHSIELNGS